MKNILLGISGSISAYKAADITSQFTKLGYNVDVIMTTNSTKFITPLTLQSLSKNPVHTDVMEEIA
ncbi:flavoprotein, partial [Enterococcus quebecensis]